MMGLARIRWTAAGIVAGLVACEGGSTAPAPHPVETPVATLDARSPGASEGLDAIVRIRLDPAPSSSITVRYALGSDDDPGTRDADEEDYEADGHVSVPAGATAAEIRIPILDDTEIEPAREVLLLTLEPPGTGAGYVLGSATSAPVTISEGVCDRTPQLRDVLVVLTRVARCTEVTESHLALTNLGLVGLDITRLRRRDLTGFYNLRFLDLSDIAFSEFPSGVFFDLPTLETLRLRGNGFETLPDSAFTGLASLKSLDLGGNAFTTLPEGAFRQLSALEELDVRANRLATVSPGAFSDLARLERLNLGSNDFTALPEGTFRGLTGLKWLYLGNGNAGELSSGLFSGLSTLESLLLQDSGIERLPTGVFSGLVNLKELRLDRNALTALPEGVFAELGRLETLRLYRNRLATLPPGVFSDLSALRSLRLDGNRLEALPEGAFVGLASLDSLRLAANPGAPFPVGLAVERTDGQEPEAAAPARIAVRLTAGAPFAMRIPLSIQGGAISADTAAIEAGTERSAEIAVTGAEDGGRAQVIGGPAPVVPPSVTGIRLRIGDPLILFGEGPNLAPVPERPVPPQRIQVDAPPAEIDATRHFRDPEGAELTFTGASGDEGVVRVAVRDTRVILDAVASGSTEVSVTARDPGGLAAEGTFQVVVRPASPWPFDIDLILIDSASASQENALRKAVRFWSSILADTELLNVRLGPDARPGCWDIRTDQHVDIVDDILIVASVREIDGQDGILARAGPCGIRGNSQLPFLAAAEFDAADLDWLEANGYLEDVEEVFRHEIGHALGLGTVWEAQGLLRNPSRGDLDIDAHFAGPLAIAAFDSLGGAGYADGEKVPVENSTGSAASDDSHWREAVLGHELMSPFQYADERDPLSAITVQSLADLGYRVRIGLSQAYRVPGPGAARADAAEPAARIPYGDDILRGPVMVVDRDGRVIRVIPH